MKMSRNNDNKASEMQLNEYKKYIEREPVSLSITCDIRAVRAAQANQQRAEAIVTDAIERT